MQQEKDSTVEQVQKIKEIVNNNNLTQQGLYILNNDKWEICSEPQYTGQGILILDKRFYYGDFENGKFNNIGTYFSQKGSVYNGEWKDGEKHGKGKVYDKNGKTIYEGQWQNGKKHGKGKAFYENGNKAYDGELKNGRRHGKGKAFYENGKKVYDGEWENGQKDGQGIFFDKDENMIYDGQWKVNLINGKGKVYDKNGKMTYDGELKNGRRHGKGKSFYENEKKAYDGEWKNGQKDGKGQAFYENGNMAYDGQWKDGEIHGKGILYDENGNMTYDGQWKDGEKHGKGFFMFKKEYTYNGNWENNLMNGQGTYIDNNITFTGTYQDNKAIDMKELKIKDKNDKMHFIVKEEGKYYYVTNNTKGKTIKTEINIQAEKRLEMTLLQLGSIISSDSKTKFNTPNEFEDFIEKELKEENNLPSVSVIGIPGHAFVVVTEKDQNGKNKVTVLDSNGLLIEDNVEYMNVINKNSDVVDYRIIDSNRIINLPLEGRKKPTSIELNYESFVCRHISGMLFQKLNELLKDQDGKSLIEMLDGYLKDVNSKTIIGDNKVRATSPEIKTSVEAMIKNNPLNKNNHFIDGETKPINNKPAIISALKNRSKSLEYKQNIYFK